MQDEFEALVAKFIRDAQKIIEKRKAALGATAARRPRTHGRVPGHYQANQKRPKRAIEAIKAALLKMITERPCHPAETYAQWLNAAPGTLAVPLKQLSDAGKIIKSGRKRGTTYEAS